MHMRGNAFFPYTGSISMSDETKKIVAARIIPANGLWNPPKVMIRLEGDTEDQQLFDYYPDELSFTAQEFIGLTLAQGRHLKFTKDKAYLTS